MHAEQIPSLQAIRDSLCALDRPDWIESVQVTENIDASGEWAVWIWLYLAADRLPAQATVQPALNDLRGRIRRTLSEQAPGLWAYIRVQDSDEAGSRQDTAR